MIFILSIKSIVVFGFIVQRMPVATHGALGTCVFDWTIWVENLGHLWHLTKHSVNTVFGRTWED